MDRLERLWLITTAVPGLAFWAYVMVLLWNEPLKVPFVVEMLFVGALVLVATMFFIGIPLRLGMNLIVPSRRQRCRKESICLVIVFAILGGTVWVFSSGIQYKN